MSDDVCYRHPDRQSWVLCERCGRTICPECQVATPNGIYCPDCVRETSGSAPRWVPAGDRPMATVTPIRRRKSPAWVRWLKQVLLPESGAPVITWGLVAATILIFIVSLFAPAIPLALIAMPGQPPWQVWRFFTSALVQASVISMILNVVFFILISPTIERMMGRAKYATLVLAGIGAGSAAMLLGGAVAYGLTGAMFGMFAAYFLIARSTGAPTTTFLVIMLVNVLFTLVLSPSFIFMIVGGVIGGGGAAALFFYHRDHGTRNPATAYWQIAGGVALLIGLAILRSSLTA